MMIREELGENVQKCKKPRNSSELICRPDVSNPPEPIVGRDPMRVKPIWDAHLGLKANRKGDIASHTMIPRFFREAGCSLNCCEFRNVNNRQALTRIRHAFELNRKSFGGSAFLKVFIERNTRMIPLDDLRDQKASIAALEAARPRDRCDSWLELSVSLSRVADVWNAQEQRRILEASSAGHVTRPRTMPKPKASDKLLETSASDYFDFRTRVLIRSEAGLIALMNRIHDPKETSDEIQKLRGFHEAMDRAVLNAFGWQDLALSARCEFLPPAGIKHSSHFRSPAQDQK